MFTAVMKILSMSCDPHVTSNMKAPRHDLSLPIATYDVAIELWSNNSTIPCCPTGDGGRVDKGVLNSEILGVYP